MADLVHVTSVESLGEYRLHLTFEDGSEGELDLSGWSWRGVFEPIDPVLDQQRDIASAALGQSELQAALDTTENLNQQRRPKAPGGNGEDSLLTNC